MKNIFKFFGIAVLACGLMVACGKENNDPTDSTPDTPDNPQPTYSVNINWDGADQTLGWKDAYQSTQNPSVFWFEGAKGMNGQNIEVPGFYIPFYNNGNVLYPAFLFQFFERDDNGEVVCDANGDTIFHNGNEYFPLEVFNEGGLTVEGTTIGDYQLLRHRYTATPAVTFDATALTLSIEVPVTMADYAAYAQGNVVTKDLTATFVNYPFEAAK